MTARISESLTWAHEAEDKVQIAEGFLNFICITRTHMAC